MTNALSPVGSEDGATARFIRYLRDVRRLSPHTLSNYQRDLDSLAHFA
ncbi:site-specific integrase, partial [Halioglobus sp.]|nr:site-specific integrase [Halioglobus sp.]